MIYVVRLKAVKIIIQLWLATIMCFCTSCANTAANRIALLEEQVYDLNWENKSLRDRVSELKQQLPPSMGETVLVRTIIPEVDFRNASIEEIMGFLSDVIRKGQAPTPAESMAARKKLIGQLQREIAILESQVGDQNVKAIYLDVPYPARVPLLTVRAEEISLLELLDLIVAFSNLEYEFSDQVITLKQKQIPQSTRLHDIPNEKPSGDPFANPEE